MSDVYTGWNDGKAVNWMQNKVQSKGSRAGCHWVCALLLGVWCAMTLGMQIVVADVGIAQEDLAVGMYDVDPVSIDGAPKLLVFFAKLRQNLPQDAWAWGVCAAALALLLYRLHKTGTGSKPGPVVAAFAAVFGVAQVLSLSICKLDSWAFVAENSYQLLLSFFCMAGYALLFYYAVWGLFVLLGRGGAAKPCTAATPFAAWWDNHAGKVSFGALLLAWAPWLAVSLPGSVDWDSHTQISQMLGDLPMTAHHTVLSTWLHGGTVALGRLLGSDNLGVFFYIALQTVFAAYVFSRMVVFAKRLQTPRGLQYGILAFFALVPAWGAYMQTMLKDTLFAAMFALFMLRTAELMMFGLPSAKRRRYLARYLIPALLTCLLRQNGVYAVVPTLLVVCVLLWRTARREMLCGTALVLASIAVFSTVTTYALAIPKGSAGEMLSIPFQQTARYVKYYADEVTPQERQAIDAVLDYDALGDNYDPLMSDGVKSTFKNPDSAAMSAYFKTWASMFIKKPVIYLQALHANTFGYYSVVNSGFAYEYYMFINDKAMAWQNLDIYYLDSAGYARYTLYNLLLAFERTPLGLLVSRGFNSWLLLALGCWLARRRCGKALPLLVGLGVLWLTCIASPVNDLLRYYLPILASMPVVICLAVYAARPKSERNLLKI